jgi:manganese/zinc/iron transport system permease protein
MNLFDFFTDPVLRAPTWGTLLMCIASSLMGVLLFLKKRTLLAESLSHATYPGVVIGVSLFALLFPHHEEKSFIAVLLGAFLSSLAALKAIEWLQSKGKVSSDAALCFILSLFFGAGIVASSAMQSSLPTWHKQIQMLLFGQAATMTDLHIALYGSLAFAISLFLALLFRPLQGALFDRDYAASTGIRVALLERIVFWLLLLSIIVGIRSVGVVLISGMVIAPAVAARQWTDQLKPMFFFAAFFGCLSGLVGNILSVQGSIFLSTETEKMILPTGPMIVLVGAAIALLSLLFAPKRGLLFRLFRIGAFHLRCLEENLLKGIWKKGPLTFENLRQTFRIPPFPLYFALQRLLREGWLMRDQKTYSLTLDGSQKASSIVRLHRLWELYLAETLKLQVEKVHKTAEEMEHILTPDIEERLTRLLSNPKQDPHQQPIPQRPQPL